VRANHLSLTLFFATLLVSFAVQSADAEGHFRDVVQPLLKEFCISCHSPEKHKGDLDLQRFTSYAAVKKDPKVWQLVAEQLSLNEMPPKKQPQPSAEQKERLAAWVQTTLQDIASANAGDPGPVVLRRLSNAEYTYTIRDLTRVATLDPAKEFPVDGAAGEGFTNTGMSLVMSPTLFTKYFDAAKSVSSHAVFLPDGLRFSPSPTRRDHTEEILARIRTLYSIYADPSVGSQVNLQGLIFNTNTGGALPLQKYFAATIAERDALASGAKTTETVARERQLNAKYLDTFYRALTAKDATPLIANLGAAWKTATPNDAAALANEVGQWQKSLWKFNTIGQIGKLNGPKSWMETVSPLTAQQEVKVKLTAPANAKDVTLYLSASTAGDGAENDIVIWQEPRLVAPGKPTLFLKDLRNLCQDFTERRARVANTAAPALAALADSIGAQNKVDAAELARKSGVDEAVLGAWIKYLGLNSTEPFKIDTLLKREIKAASKHDFINGYGFDETPCIFANSSDTLVRIPGNMKPHSVAIHPSPKLQSVVGWLAPVAATVNVESVVERAHPECGNGVNWSIELRRGLTRQQLAAGNAHDSKPHKSGVIQNISVQPGDLISLLIHARDDNHSCDLTAIDLVINATGAAPQNWSLSGDVSPDILAGNPHADRLGNKNVWHFYTEPADAGARKGTLIPAGSLLAKWLMAPKPEDKTAVATELQKLLQSNTAPKDGPDAALYNQLTALGGPLLSGFASAAPTTPATTNKEAESWGLDPALFGKHPNGSPRDAKQLCVQAPSVLEVRLPVALVAGYEFVANCSLDAQTGAEGSVQFSASTEKPASDRFNATAPVVVANDSGKRKRFEAAFDDARQLFPAALCYTKIVPADEVITIWLYYREDHHLMRLMLNDEQKAQLDKLWDELRYVSQDAFALVDVFEQIWQYSTQDGDPKSLEPLREPIAQGAAALKKRLVETEPYHLDAVLRFADRAYRRPLRSEEQTQLRALYKKLREESLPHDEAIRLTLARVLVSPAFLYKAEAPAPGKTAGPVSDLELANRLSYFLWSSMPDEELRSVAAAGKLRDPVVLTAQAKRMLADPRVRHMAVEFGCSWLHIHGFDELGEKSDRHFPTFVALRGAMYEETIQFFTDFFQNDRSVLSLLDANHTYLNEDLAKHYGIPDVKGAQWRRVENVRRFARGGILTQATTLAKQSGASRTSPILRGNWIAETLLGDKLPKPPKDVPQLPEEAGENLTMRQLTEKHTSDQRCAGCHARIDAYGFSMEAFDAIGRLRDKEGNVPIDTRAKVMDGTEITGVDGLRGYILEKKRDTYLRQFSRKLLGYSLGRGVQLSDEALLKDIQESLKASNFRVGVAVERIILSPQFQNIRGAQATFDE